MGTPRIDEMRIKNAVLKELELLKEKLIEMNNFLCLNPELEFREKKAVEILTSMLEDHGFKVEKELAGLETAFRATCKGKGESPTIALIASYDASTDVGLPRPMHSCGHNLIAMISVGAAIALSRVISFLKGTLVVVGTPGIESVTKIPGNVVMADEGVFDSVDVAVSVHPYTKTFVPSGSMAATTIEIEFKGKAGWLRDRSTWPLGHKEINALNAVILTFNAVNALRQHLRSDVMINGIVSRGGDREGVIPEYAAARYEILANDGDYLKEVVERIKNCARAAELATGAKVSFKIHKFIDELKFNKTLSRIFRENLKELGIPLSPNELIKGYIGVGNISQVCCLIHPFIKLREDLKVHTEEFAQAACSEDGHKALMTGVKAVALTIIDILTKPKFMTQIKKDFGDTS